MGTFEVSVRVFSLDGADRVDATMMVDTGATFSLLPASMLCQLRVREQLQVETQDATGEVETVPVGLAMIEIDSLIERVPVLVAFGREHARPLLGAHALEAFRLSVDPVAQVLRPVRAYML